MKRILLIFITVISANAFMFAQSHIRFLDIPLNGEFDTFKENLEQKDIYKDSYGKYGFSGIFFGTIASVSVGYNEETLNVYSALVRYNQSMTNLSEDKIIALYNRIRQGLIKKYPKVQTQSIDGQLLLILKNGYIYLRAFEAPKVIGGITIELEYVDKLNSPKYEIPKLKSIENDL